MESQQQQQQQPVLFSLEHLQKLAAEYERQAALATSQTEQCRGALAAINGLLNAAYPPLSLVSQEPVDGKKNDPASP